ncbi:MAG: alpha/beta hydrolase [Gammaproteobacteria bacterium]|nr:alpha/beta hydrolase [Gammaproteobacteria bacterium]MDH4313638.1 alpha/beta hydrolase [Gammaproteobacteria bacterium]MDH5213851.1 alpha/beta hydrolase [Gammaproteobacteria bacterium]
MISLRARFVRFMSNQYFKRITPDTDVAELRKSWDEIASKLKPASGVRRREAIVDHIHCEWLVPEKCDEAPAILYLHGGIYLVGSATTHRRLVSYVAKTAGMRALIPNYRLAPEHPFPAAIEDAKLIYRKMLEQGIASEKIAIGGDSAGGGLTMATLLALKDEGVPLPGAAFLMSPWLDLAAQGESLVTRKDQDPWFDPDNMSEMVRRYCGNEDRKNPLVSPLYGELSGLPPMLVQVGDHEILLSDSTRLSDRVSAAGGKVTLQVWPDMWHVFQYFVGQMPESMRAIEDISDFLNKHVG